MSTARSIFGCCEFVTCKRSGFDIQKNWLTIDLLHSCSPKCNLKGCQPWGFASVAKIFNFNPELERNYLSLSDISICWSTLVDPLLQMLDTPLDLLQIQTFRL